MNVSNVEISSSDSAQASRSNTWRSFLKQPANVILLMLAVLLWLQLIITPFVGLFLTGSERLDGSWQYCNAYFLKHHLRPGIDFIFPTTLLAPFYCTAYDPALFWYFWAWQLAMNALLVYNLYRLCLLYPTLRLRAALLLVSAVFLNISNDVTYMILIVTISQVLLFTPEASPARTVLNVFALALLSLTKFTFQLQGILIAVFAVYPQIKQKRPVYQSPALLYAVFLAALWMALHQHISDVPTYFHNLLLVTTGFNTGMGIEGKAYRILVGVCSILLLGAVAGKVSQQTGPSGRLGLALFALILAQMWKYGFVRNDSHALYFYAFMIILTLIIPVYSGAYKPLPRWCAGALVSSTIVCLLAFLKANDWSSDKQMLIRLTQQPLWGMTMALTPWRVNAERNAQYVHAAQIWDMPTARARVQNATVDVFGNDCFVALLNQFNYRPRPVYQSYTAYTPSLEAINSAYYRDVHGPAYVLFTLDPIDEHWPALEDGATLLELLRFYHPVLVEKGIPLLARNTIERPPTLMRAPRTIMKTIRLGQEIMLPEPRGSSSDWHLLSIHVHHALRDKLRSIALRPAPTYMGVRMTDGETKRYRIVPEVAEAPFLLDPTLGDAREFVSLYGRPTGKRVRSFWIESAGPPGQNLRAELEITLTTTAPLVGPPLEEQQIASLQLPQNWLQPQN